MRKFGFLIYYNGSRGTCIDFQYGVDMFEAVSAFRLDGRRKPSAIAFIRQIGA